MVVGLPPSHHTAPLHGDDRDEGPISRKPRPGSSSSTSRRLDKDTHFSPTLFGLGAPCGIGEFASRNVRAQQQRQLPIKVGVNAAVNDGPLLLSILEGAPY